MLEEVVVNVWLEEQLVSIWTVDSSNGNVLWGIRKVVKNSLVHQ